MKNASENLSAVLKTSLPMVSVHKNHGFSFIELIIVVVIIGLLALVGFPTLLKWIPNINLRTAVIELRDNMYKARSEAVKRNGDFAIVFEPANNAYHLCSSSGADGNWSTLADNSVENSVLLNNYNHGVQFGMGDATVTADGIPAADNVTYTGPAPTDNTLIFTPKGTSNAGFAHFTHKDNTTAWAAGTQVSGVVQIRRWGGVWK